MAFEKELTESFKRLMNVEVVDLKSGAEIRANSLVSQNTLSIAMISMLASSSLLMIIMLAIMLIMYRRMGSNRSEKVRMNANANQVLN